MRLTSLPRSRPAIYGFAVVCVALAALLSWASGVILNIPAMLLPFTMAVAAAAWFGGLQALRGRKMPCGALLAVRIWARR